MNAQIREIKAHLGLAPRTAQDLAESTGLTLEDTYHSLVWLYDRDEARISKDRLGEVFGWTEGRNA